MPTIDLNLTKKQITDLYNAHKNGGSFKLNKGKNIFKIGKKGKFPIYLTDQQLHEFNNKGTVTLTPEQTKEGGFLPALLPFIIPAIGAAATAGSAIAKTVYDVRNQNKQLDETERHNRALEAKVGSGCCMSNLNQNEDNNFACKKCGKSYELKKQGCGFTLRPFTSMKTSPEKCVCGTGLYLSKRRGAGLCLNSKKTVANPYFLA
jgi:hypothetical protein